MTGLNGHRVYLDWNATAPLRPEARAAMLEAMDLVGNPSSFHAEGRAAKAVVEKARGQVAALVGCEPSEVVFTSGATEAIAAVGNYLPKGICWPVEHDCVRERFSVPGGLTVRQDGVVEKDAEIDFQETGLLHWTHHPADLIALTSASGETGVRQPLKYVASRAQCAEGGAMYMCIDGTQSIGRCNSPWSDDVDFTAASAHKLGGPKGSGALIVKQGIDMQALLKGGGQEQGRRSGTENVIGIAGFGAAAEAAQRDLEAGVWERVEKLRDALEDKLAAAAPDLVIFGKDAPRLPNTSCFAIRGWSGETQVMQMDLSGFAVSAGSACSSGKVGPSRVILAMTGNEELARSAIRVSMGPTTTEAEVMAFADVWIEHYRRRREKAA